MPLLTPFEGHVPHNKMRDNFEEFCKRNLYNEASVIADLFDEYGDDKCECIEAIVDYATQSEGYEEDVQRLEVILAATLLESVIGNGGQKGSERISAIIKDLNEDCGCEFAKLILTLSYFIVDRHVIVDAESVYWLFKSKKRNVS